MRAKHGLMLLSMLLFQVAVGCGDDEANGGDDGSGELTVSAASSLSTALPDYADNVLGEEVKFSFAGSDELAAQIRQGALPDVYAAANTDLPEALYGEDLVEDPVEFATNQLVLAVPADSEIASLEDLTAEGVTIAIGDPEVPVGSYTREVLERLPASESEAILTNVGSEEPDVAGIVGKLTQGAVDAGFVYATDVVAAGDRLEAISLPSDLRPDVTYGIAVVVDSANPDAAQSFVDGLLEPDGQQVLADAGFLPPP